MTHRLLTEDPKRLTSLELVWALQDAYCAARTKTAIDGTPANGRLEAVSAEMVRRLDRERHTQDSLDAWEAGYRSGRADVMDTIEGALGNVMQDYSTSFGEVRIDGTERAEFVLEVGAAILSKLEATS